MAGGVSRITVDGFLEVMLHTARDCAHTLRTGFDFVVVIGG